MSGKTSVSDLQHLLKDAEREKINLQKQLNQVVSAIKLEESTRRRDTDSKQKDAGLRRKLMEEIDEEKCRHEESLTKMEDAFQRQAREMQSQARRVQFEEPQDDQWQDVGDEAAQHDESEFPMAPEPDPLEVEADQGATWRELHDREEQRFLLAQTELQRVTSELNALKASTDKELQAASEARQKLLEHKMAADKLNEEKVTELKEVERKSEALQKNQEDLERDTKMLQRQLSQAMYDVGKKDREQQLKEADLMEVRQSIQTIQSEMDEVNGELQAQCGRVQRVEGSLRLSRDLGSKVQNMREMLKESHEALGQLCSIVEQERIQRDECSQGLRQQQMRTELLLQLLTHFKSRTQDLAPQVLLSQAAESQGGQSGVASLASTGPFPSERTASPGLASPGISAFPPVYAYANTAPPFR